MHAPSRSRKYHSGNSADTGGPELFKIAHIVAEWDTETVSPHRLADIEKEFNEKMTQGWFAADILEKRNVLIREFDPNADILLIPRVQGGR
jgi:hypothetical protein